MAAPALRSARAKAAQRRVRCTALRRLPVSEIFDRGGVPGGVAGAPICQDGRLSVVCSISIGASATALRRSNDRTEARSVRSERASSPRSPSPSATNMPSMARLCRSGGGASICAMCKAAAAARIRSRWQCRAAASAGIWICKSNLLVCVLGAVGRARSKCCVALGVSLRFDPYALALSQNRTSPKQPSTNHGTRPCRPRLAGSPIVRRRGTAAQ